MEAETGQVVEGTGREEQGVGGGCGWEPWLGVVKAAVEL